MKSHFSRVVALSLSASVSAPVWAQPPAPVAPEPPKPVGPKYTQPNLEAIGLIGAFFTKLRRAESYRGHVVANKTILKDRKVVSTRTIEVQVSWIRDKEQENVYKKTNLDLAYTVVADEKTSVDNINVIEDSVKKYTFYESKNTWSKLSQSKNNAPLPLAFANVGMILGLLTINGGQEFLINRKIIDGKDRITVGVDANSQFIFDAATSNLLSLNTSSNTEKVEIRWLESEFDVPLPDPLFEWKVPDGATEVAPGETVVNVQF